jgi:AcrR family transcriptional regulator
MPPYAMAGRTPRGRPREFAFKDALSAALEVFWSKGYEGTSIDDLCTAMGVGKSSLYASFGNKEEVFRKVLDVYITEKLAYTREALAEPTARAVAEHFMRGGLEAQVSGSDPSGCLGVITVTANGPDAAPLKALAISRGKLARTALNKRFERAKAEGDLPPGIDVVGLTSFLFAILQGMAVQAVSGANRADLERLIETGMAIWPGR